VCEWSASRPGRFTPGKDPVPIAQEAGWAPELVWIGAENLTPPEFDPRTFQPVAIVISKCIKKKIIIINNFFVTIKLYYLCCTPSRNYDYIYYKYI
jgi:hypothetical protein